MTKRRLPPLPACAVLAAMTSLAACGGEEVVQNTIQEDAAIPPSGTDVPVLPKTEPTEDDGQGETPDAQAGTGALPPPGAFRFVGLWATEADLCADTAWHFTREGLETPAGSVCKFVNATPVGGGYDISARCVAEGPPVDDNLKIRFAESAQAMLFEAESIADAGLIYCGASSR